MYNRMIPDIPPGAKIIIGLGDSFTQGVGSWPKEVWDRYDGNINTLKIPLEIFDQMYDYSWVKQLCDNHMPDWTPINLGCLGTGNRSAVKNLHLHPKIKFENASKGIVILMLSGMERFDFVNKDFPEHNHFYTMWPNPWDKNTTNKKLWEAYAESIWSEKFICVETLLNIKEAETYCKAHGFHLIIGSAFDIRITKDYFMKHLGESHPELVNSIPWGSFCQPGGVRSFMEMLLIMEGRGDLVAGGFYDYCQKLKGPTDFVTPCAHPSQNGYAIMASQLYEYIVSKKML